MNNNAIAVIDAFTDTDVKPVSVYLVTLDSPENVTIREAETLELRIFYEMDDWDINENGLLSTNLSFMEGIYDMMKNLYMLRIKPKDMFPANTNCQGLNFVTYKVTRAFGEEMLLWNARKKLEEYKRKLDNAKAEA